MLHLTRGLEERGIVSVAATRPGGVLARRLRQQDLPLIELPLASGFSPRAVRSLQQLLSDRHWHILHAHGSYAHTLAFLAFRLPPARPFHRPSLLVTRRAGALPSRDPLTRLKFTAAGQTVICVSEFVRGVMQQYGVPAESLRVVPSGVPIPRRSDPFDPLPSEIAPAAMESERRELRTELGVPDGALLAGSSAPLAEGKGHRTLLRAWTTVVRALPAAHLVLMGEGEIEAELRGLAAGLGLASSVTFAGAPVDPVRYLDALDLYVLASTEEGLGTSILEAMADGVPVVAARAGGIPEAVEDGVTGALVPPDDEGTLASALSGLLADEARRRRMGAAGRAWVAERFPVERMVEETLAIYRDVSSRAL